MITIILVIVNIITIVNNSNIVTPVHRGRHMFAHTDVDIRDVTRNVDTIINIAALYYCMTQCAAAAAAVAQ